MDSGKIRIYLKLMNIDRSQTIIASLLLGLALGARTGFLGNIPTAVALSAALLLIYGGGAVMNNVSDARFDGKSNPISAGAVGGRSALWFSLALNAAGFLITCSYGLFPAAIGLALVFAGVVYSYSFRIKDKVWCTMFLGMTHHVLPITLGYYVALGFLDGIYALFAAAIYVFIVGVILVKDFKDIERDRNEGRKNIAMLLGLDKTARVVFSSSAAYVILTAVLMKFTGVYANTVLSDMLLASSGGIALMGALLVRNPTQKFGEKVLPNYRKLVSANFLSWALAFAMT